MELTILGTGNAVVTACYNTCFALSENGSHFLVDGGGGNELLRRLQKAEIRWQDITDVFVTHKHIDHVLGIIWLLRLFCQGAVRGTYTGEVDLYAHREMMDLLCQLAEMLLQPKEAAQLGKCVRLHALEDGDCHTILGQKVTFFDIGSTKAKQFGFAMELENGKLTCCGDEPFNDRERPYAEGSKWLLHEAFCLFSQADIFKPYQKNHSTVKDACQLAEELKVENLILYHTEDKNIAHRKEFYTAEGKEYFHGNLFVPEDMEIFEL